MLYQHNIFHLLKTGDGQHSREFFFQKAMMEEAYDVARQLGGQLRPSPLRLAQAQDYWERDIRNFNDDHIQSHSSTSPIEPDEFKQAAYLAYWLRRRIVFEPLGDGNDRFFQQYVNELVSFVIGFRLCHYHQGVRPDLDDAEVKARLRNFRLRRSYLNEVAVFLHHKNVSPHALYLICRGLFENAIPPAAATAPHPAA